jgi:hypothetical protein
MFLGARPDVHAAEMPAGLRAREPRSGPRCADPGAPSVLTELEGLDESRLLSRARRRDLEPAHIVEASGACRRLASSAAPGTRWRRAVRCDPRLWDPLRKLPFRTGLASAVRIRTVAGADRRWTRPRRSLAPNSWSGSPPLGPRRSAPRRAPWPRSSRIWLRHPFFGAFTLPEMMGWVAWHEDRHRKQAGARPPGPHLRTGRSPRTTWQSAPDSQFDRSSAL